MCISNSCFFDSNYGIFLAKVNSTNERKNMFTACSDITFSRQFAYAIELFSCLIAVKVYCQFFKLSMQLAIAMRPKLGGWLALQC